MDNYTTVSIPKQLAEKVRKRIANTGFNSLSDYVTFVLREIISEGKEKQKKEAFSKSDEERVKRRLKSLGYLD